MADINLNPRFSPIPGRQPERTAVDGAACEVDHRDVATLSGASSQPVILDRKTALIAAAGSSEAPADHVVEITDATFDDFIKNAKTPVFMEFWNPT